MSPKFCVFTSDGFRLRSFSASWIFMNVQLVNVTSHLLKVGTGMLSGIQKPTSAYLANGIAKF